MAVLMPSPDVSSVPGCYRKASTKILSSSNPRMVQNFKASKVVRSGIRVLVSSKIKDLEPKVSDLAENVGNYGNFSANAAEVKQSKEDEARQNYYVNTGDAIRTIREEFPDLFYRELSFDIYRDDIVFKDPLNTFFGIENYKSIFSALRFHGKIFFKALWVDIISVWQPVESTIMVRWTVHGIPRVPWESRGRFDGTSEYKLDKHGKIYEHKVHNIALNAPPRFHVLSVNEIIQSLGCPSTPKPTFFEISSPQPSESSNLSATLDTMNEYLTSVLIHNAEPSQQQ